MRGYLERAQLGLIIGDTVFVHGGISPDSLGWLPPPHTRPEADAREWINKLNAFAREQIEKLPGGNGVADNDKEWSDGYAWSTEGGYTGRGADDLLQYGLKN